MRFSMRDGTDIALSGSKRFLAAIAAISLSVCFPPQRDRAVRFHRLHSRARVRAMSFPRRIPHEARAKSEGTFSQSAHRR